MPILLQINFFQAIKYILRPAFVVLFGFGGVALLYRKTLLGFYYGIGGREGRGLKSGIKINLKTFGEDYKKNLHSKLLFYKCKTYNYP